MAHYQLVQKDVIALFVISNFENRHDVLEIAKGKLSFHIVPAINRQIKCTVYYSTVSKTWGRGTYTSLRTSQS